MLDSKGSDSQKKAKDNKPFYQGIVDKIDLLIFRFRKEIKGLRIYEDEKGHTVDLTNYTRTWLPLSHNSTSRNEWT